jgi:hypothetical protein
MLALLVTVLTTITGQPCVAIDNTTNTAAFESIHGQIVQTHYTDYGDNLGYDVPIVKSSWPAIGAAESALRNTPKGPKLQVACTYTENLL